MQIRKKLCLFYLVTIVFASDNNYLKSSESKKIIGSLQVGQLKKSENISAFARRFDIGYDELSHANPNANLESVRAGDVLVVPSQHLLLAKYKKGIVVNLPERRMYNYLLGTGRVLTYPVGIGKLGWNTPLGELTVIGMRKNPHWYVPASVMAEHEKDGVTLPKVVPPGPDNPLGSRAIRLSSPSYLIHGTNEPEGVGKRSTAGCISMYPEDIRSLYKQTKISTNVVIVNEPIKWYKKSHELCVEVHPSLILQNDELAEVDYLFSKEEQKNILALEAKYNIVAQHKKYWQQILQDKLGVPQCVQIVS